MNHQPFRSWLLSEEELTTEQSQALQEHLYACDACSQLDVSWKELESVITRSPQLPSAPGFVERWQANLVEYQQLRQKQKGWLTIGTTSFIVVSLLVLVALQVWSLIQAPDAYLAVWFDRLLGVLSIFFSLRNLVSAYSLPGLVYTVAVMVFLVGMISFMSVLWLATYRKISMARRTV